ncbi:MAG: SLBB domain-containing protein [bacterium]
MIKNIFLFLLFAAGLYAQDESTSKSNKVNLASSISVSVGGGFIVTGTFPALPTERVDQFVTRLLNEAKAEKLSIIKDFDKQEQFLKDFEKIAKRNIRLKKNNGTEYIVDLEKFRLTGDYKYNSYLSHEDVLIFPDYDPETGFVSIDGAVNNSVTFQYVQGDKFSDALLFAHGLNAAFENVTIFNIIRLSYDGQKEEVKKYNINDNPDLKIGDRIIVLADETNRKDFKIFVAGEINRPGNIPITKNATTLRDIISKFGGFKETADLNRAELIRGANVFKSPIFSEDFERLLMQRMANISEEDSISFLTDNKLRFARGNAVLDFTKLADSNSVESSFILKDGDYIFIPEKLDLVYVFGQVKFPGYINYVDGQNINFYINHAGGIGKTAKEEIYLIKGKSRGWTLIEEETEYTVEPGDFIWIPKEIPRTFDYYTNRIMAVSSVVGTLATIVLLIVQLGK